MRVWIWKNSTYEEAINSHQELQAVVKYEVFFLPKDSKHPVQYDKQQLFVSLG